MKNYFLLILLVGITVPSKAQEGSAFKGFERLFVQPKHYEINYTSIPPVIDGGIDDKVWEVAAWTEEFRDIEGELSSRPVPYYRTWAKMLWDDDYLYVAAKLEDKHVWAYLTEHDQVVYHDNDFEVFIDPRNSGHQYYEYEINALNTIFDLYLTKPYRNSGSALVDWDSKGLKHAIRVKGTLNDPSDQDEGWTVEMAIPFRDIGGKPSGGDFWRLGFSRVEWDTEIIDNKYVKQTNEKGNPLPENNWVWSPQGEINMHMPERWAYIQFSKAETSAKLPEFELPYSERQRQYLWLVYYKQQEYRKKNERFATSLKKLGISTKVKIDGKSNTLKLKATCTQFTVSISDSPQTTILINEDGLVKIEEMELNKK
ncbi:MAG: carbohydrate-binding family 9-like protein [Mediterranea sp.]|jgi:hypothetical protein|nr:carbohydrate-binding family 9-like protein [Mediterranea sp.]